jgi:hypothetical protein
MNHRISPQNNRKRPFRNVKNPLTLVSYNLASRSLFPKRPWCAEGDRKIKQSCRVGWERGGSLAAMAPARWNLLM